MTHPVVSTRSLKLSEWVIKKEIEKLRPVLIYQNQKEESKPIFDT
jgi:hypothetical protein